MKSIESQEYLDRYKLEDYIREKYKLDVTIHKEGGEFVRVGSFSYNNTYYAVTFCKPDGYINWKKRGKSKSAKSNPVIEVPEVQNLLSEVTSLRKELLHLQKVFGADKVITLDDKQIKLLGEQL